MGAQFLSCCGWTIKKFRVPDCILTENWPWLSHINRATIPNDDCFYMSVRFLSYDASVTLMFYFLSSSLCCLAFFTLMEFLSITYQLIHTHGHWLLPLHLPYISSDSQKQKLYVFTSSAAHKLEFTEMNMRMTGWVVWPWNFSVSLS